MRMTTRRSHRSRTARDDGFSHEARELVLFIDNNYELNRQKDAFLSNVHTKMKRGVYDPTAAVKLWMYYVERGAKAYAKEFSIGTDWARMFPPAVRREVAKHYEAKERGEIERGEHSKYPPVVPGVTKAPRRRLSKPGRSHVPVRTFGGPERDAGKVVSFKDHPQRVQIVSIGEPTRATSYWKPGQFGYVIASTTHGGMHPVNRHDGRGTRTGETAYLVSKAKHGRGGALWFTADALRFTRLRRHG